MEHLGAVADVRADAVEYGDFVFGGVAVAAEQAAVGVRADDGDGLDLREIERGEVVFVLQKGNGFVRGLKGDFAVGVATGELV